MASSAETLQNKAQASGLTALAEEASSLKVEIAQRQRYVAGLLKEGTSATVIASPERAKQSISKLDTGSRILMQDSSSQGALAEYIKERFPQSGQAIVIESELLDERVCFATTLLAVTNLSGRFKDNKNALEFLVVGNFTEEQTARLKEAAQGQKLTVIPHEAGNYRKELLELKGKGRQVSVLHRNTPDSHGFFRQRFTLEDGTLGVPGNMKYIAVEKGARGIINGLRAIWAAFIAHLVNDSHFLTLFAKEGGQVEELKSLLHSQGEGMYLHNATPQGTDKELDEYYKGLQALTEAT